MDILLDVLFALELLRPIKPFKIWMCATSFKRLDKFDFTLPTLQISIGWLSVISSVIPLALKGFYL